MFADLWMQFMKAFREKLDAAIRTARANGYSVETAETTRCIRVIVISPSGRSEYEYYFFADSSEEELNETLNDLINWVK